MGTLSINSTKASSTDSSRRTEGQSPCSESEALLLILSLIKWPNGHQNNHRNLEESMRGRSSRMVGQRFTSLGLCLLAGGTGDSGGGPLRLNREANCADDYF